jgi:hypothetical protein
VVRGVQPAAYRCPARLLLFEYSGNKKARTKFFKALGTVSNKAARGLVEQGRAKGQ